MKPTMSDHFEIDEDTLATFPQSTQLLAREFLAHKRSESTLAGFATEYCEVTPAKHHKLICDAIDRLLNDEFDDLVINSPPGSAKSLYTSIALPAYFLAKHPKKTVIAASHGYELAEKWGKKVRAIVDGEKYGRRFGVKLSQDTRAAGQWATTEGGEFFAVGVGGGVLGRRSDCTIIDDPVSGWEEANSITRLKKIHEWYETDLMSRLKPNGKIVLICQRLNRNDLAGYIIDRHKTNPTRRLHILKLPMECVDAETDLLGRQVGERMWPEWYTQSMVADFKRDNFIWQTMYQQEPPSDDGAWVNTDDIQFRVPTDDPHMMGTYYGMTDIALSVNKGDYTVHIVVRIGDNNEVDIIHAERARVDVNVSSQRLCILAKRYSPVEWLIDDDNASKVFVQLVSTESRATSSNVNWKPMPMRGQDKETRAAPLRGMFKRRKIFMPPDTPWTSWLVKEMLQFPNAMGDGVDDGVDTLSLLGRRLSALSSSVVTVLPQETKVGFSLNDIWCTAPSGNSGRI